MVHVSKRQCDAVQIVLFVRNIVVFICLYPVSLLSVPFSFDAIAHPFGNCVSLRTCMCLIQFYPFYHTSVESASRIVVDEKFYKPAPSTDDYLCAAIYVLASIYVDYVRKANEFASFDPSAHFARLPPSHSPTNKKKNAYAQ